MRPAIKGAFGKNQGFRAFAASHSAKVRSQRLETTASAMPGPPLKSYDRNYDREFLPDLQELRDRPGKLNISEVRFARISSAVPLASGVVIQCMDCYRDGRKHRHPGGVL